MTWQVIADGYSWLRVTSCRDVDCGLLARPVTDSSHAGRLDGNYVEIHRAVGRAPRAAEEGHENKYLRAEFSLEVAKLHALLATEAAASFFGVTPRYFRDNCRTRGIEAVRFGHRTIRFRPEDLAEFARKMARP